MGTAASARTVIGGWHNGEATDVDECRSTTHGDVGLNSTTLNNDLSFAGCSVDPQHMTITQPDQLIHAVPYLLGFHPHESVVLIWINRGSIVLTQRYDVDAPAPIPVLQSAADRVEATDVFICAFRNRQPGASFVEDMQDLANNFARVLDAIVVVGNRWTSVLCAQPCCPPGGRLVDPDIADEIAVQFIAHGMSVLDSRADLIAEITPDERGIAELRRELGAFGPPEMSSAALTQAIEQCWRDVAGRIPQPASIDESMLHIFGIRDVAVREELVWHLARLTPAELLAIGSLLAGVLRVAPSDDDVVHIATLLAMVRWLSGDGARAWVSLDRALSHNAEHPLANLMAHALSVGIPPGEWRSVLDQVTVDSATSME